jgi:NCAIR mutase (PurE)-related protein
MEVEQVRALLEQVQGGTTSVDQALESLRRLPFEDIGFAKLDHHRALRNGFPEVIYCQGKRTDHIISILERLTLHSRKVLGTRVAPEVAQAVREVFPQTVYHEAARIIVVAGSEEIPASEVQTLGTVLVVAAGTADFPVAEEAFVTASEMGSPTERLYDVGVAGLHRLLSSQNRLYEANVLIVVAGMEGALPSVVGGLVSRPVVAVPTSVGYGAQFNGLAPLLTMLNSCATGIGVVNIDNGFGAGFLAHLINLRPPTL